MRVTWPLAALAVLTVPADAAPSFGAIEDRRLEFSGALSVGPAKTVNGQMWREYDRGCSVWEPDADREANAVL
jgi:hypothetical protein